MIFIFYLCLKYMICCFVYRLCIMELYFLDIGKIDIKIKIGIYYLFLFIFRVISLGR